MLVRSINPGHPVCCKCLTKNALTKNPQSTTGRHRPQPASMYDIAGMFICVYACICTCKIKDILTDCAVTVVETYVWIWLNMREHVVFVFFIYGKHKDAYRQMNQFNKYLTKTHWTERKAAMLLYCVLDLFKQNRQKKEREGITILPEYSNIVQLWLFLIL